MSAFRNLKALKMSLMKSKNDADDNSRIIKLKIRIPTLI